MQNQGELPQTAPFQPTFSHFGQVFPHQNPTEVIHLLTFGGWQRPAVHSLGSRFAVCLRLRRRFGRLVRTPVNIQLIGDEVAIAWDDGGESYFLPERLRAASPSAANQGERDILGNRYGGDGPRQFPGVKVTRWERVGNYALRFEFSDGHRTGLYTYDYLRALPA